MNIILCGFKNCGKTSVAEAFALNYNYDVLDSDDLICQHYNEVNNTYYSLIELYHTVGETEFRALETKVIHSIKQLNKTIIATGGGVITNPDNIKHLKSMGKIVYLYAELEVICQRIMSQDKLPSFISADNTENDIKDYIASRKGSYESIADHTLDTSKKTIDEVVLLLNQYRCQHGQ